MFNFIKKLFNKDIKIKKFYPINHSVFDYSELSTNDYLRLYLGIQYTAVSTIAASVAKLKRRLKKSKNSNEEIEHPYFDLITYELLLGIVSFMELTGSAYIYLNRIGNKIDSLELLRPDLVEINQEDGKITSYTYYNNGNITKIAPEDIITIDLFNPLQTYPYKLKGVSPMQAVAIQAEMDLASSKWNWNLFRQGTHLGGIFETNEKISREGKERLYTEFNNAFQGVNNTHKVIILDEGLKFREWRVSKKELDFVESRRFTRDEILSIFKVPKSVLGITDGVNKASAEAGNKIFYEVCIEPLARQIQSKFNKTLFKGIGYFEFIDIVPIDRDLLLQEYQNNIITKNEYRKMRGYPTIENGDVFANDNNTNNNTDTKINKIENKTDNKKDNKIDKNIDNKIEKLVKDKLKKYIVGSQEWKEKIWYEKIKRTDKREKEMVEKINEIFTKQEKDILKGLKNKAFNFDEEKYTILWNIVLKTIFINIMKEEGDKTNEIIGISAGFNIGQTRVKKFIEENIDRIAKDVDKTTKKEILNIIKEGNELGWGSDKIAKKIKEKFKDFRLNRAKTIARTEITNATNEAAEIAFINSGVVKEKEFLAELDNRTSDICRALNGKRFKLGEVILKKGDSVAGYINNYRDVKHPPLHPNCRSTLIPVIE